MESKDLSSKVLEGLIHNIRSPLNLIMGYSQRLQKSVDSELLSRIRSSCMNIEELLQDTWDSLHNRTDHVMRQSLLEWLKLELVILGSILELKHKFLCEVEYPEQDVSATFSSAMLSTVVEGILMFIGTMQLAGSTRIVFTITKKPAIEIEAIGLCKDAIHGKLISDHISSLAIPTWMNITFQPDKGLIIIGIDDAK